MLARPQAPRNQIFIMGCGRSGTWLLAALFTTFKDTELGPDEVEVEHFASYSTQCANLVLKRGPKSYLRPTAPPPEVRLVYIIRHPFDVLTSHNSINGRKYHLGPRRWCGEMEALWQLEGGGRQITVVRYEDLVTDPVGVQARLARAFGLEISVGIEDLPSTFKPAPGTAKAMHGVWPIDQNSLYRYRHDPEKVAHLRAIRSRLEPHLTRIAARSGYDTDLDSIGRD
jgi:hypothetical protein